MAASPISTKGGDAGRSLTFLSSSMSKGILNMNNEKEVLFSVSHLKKYFQVGKNATLKAVDDVSFEIYKGETLGMVGESGCGKTTCGRTCIGLYSRTDGEVLFKGKDPQKLTGKEKQNYKKSVQMVFQDPYGSLDPRMTVAEIIGEGIDIHHLAKNKKERNERMARRKEQEKQWELAQTQQDILLKQVDELLEKKRTQNTRGPKVHDEEPEDFDYDEGYTDDEDDYGDYDEEQEAELDRWLAGLDDGQDEDR